MSSLEAQVARKGKAGACPELSAWEGRGAVLRMAPASWNGTCPCWWGARSHAGVPAVLCWLFQAANGLPKSLSTSCRRCSASTAAAGSPACRTTPGEDASCAQNRAGNLRPVTGLRCL